MWSRQCTLQVRDKLPPSAPVSYVGLRCSKDILDLPFENLPASIYESAPNLQKLCCRAPSASFDMSAMLAMLPQLKQLTVKGRVYVLAVCALLLPALCYLSHPTNQKHCTILRATKHVRRGVSRLLRLCTHLSLR